MNRKEILGLLNMGENCEIEFKETRSYLPKSIWSTYSALANTKGGIIILGITEKGKDKFEVSGINNPSYILKDFWNTIEWKEKGWIEPSIEQLYNPDRTILKLTMRKKENKNVIENVVENVAENLSAQEMMLLDVIMKDNKITQSQMAEKLNISARQISRRLKVLKEKEIIERIGSDRKGYWKIINSN